MVTHREILKEDAWLEIIINKTNLVPYKSVDSVKFLKVSQLLQNPLSLPLSPTQGLRSRRGRAHTPPRALHGMDRKAQSPRTKKGGQGWNGSPQ